jgi:hypothetical protein
MPLGAFSRVTVNRPDAVSLALDEPADLAGRLPPRKLRRPPAEILPRDRRRLRDETIAQRVPMGIGGETTRFVG